MRIEMNSLVRGFNNEGKECWLLWGDVLKNGDSVEVLVYDKWVPAKFEVRGKKAFVNFGPISKEIGPNNIDENLRKFLEE